MDRLARDAINRRAAEAFAERTGSDSHWYHAIDTHRKAAITKTRGTTLQPDEAQVAEDTSCN